MAPTTKARVIAVLAGTVLLTGSAFSQASTQAPAPAAPGAGSTTGSTGSTGSTGTTPGRPPTITTPTTPTQPSQNERLQFPEMNRPIFLSGKVVLDDGTPPPDTVVIERVCNGINRPEAYTDTKGRFSFELGRNQNVFADASVGSTGGMGPGLGSSGGIGNQGSMGGFGGGGRGFSERDLMGCELRAVLPGYRSDVVSLASRRSFDNPEVGQIVLHRMGNVEGRVISATSLNAPKDAKKAFDKAQDAIKRKKFEDAEKNLEKAVEVYPKYAAAWYGLGRLQERGQKPAEAKKSYRAAVAADAKYIQPWLALSEMAAKERNWEEAAETSGRALKLDPFSYARTYFLHSVASFNLKKYDDAEKSAREAVKLDSKHEYPKAEHLLGVLLAERRDYTGAAEQMRNYLKFAPGAQDAAVVRNQLAEIEKLATGGGAQVQPAPGQQP